MRKANTIIFGSVLLVWGAYAFHFGKYMSSDSYLYMRWADLLLEKHFNLYGYLKDVWFPVPPLFYLGFVILVALAKIIGGNLWPYVIIICNVICGGLTAVMLADIVWKITGEKVCVWMSVILFALNLEIVLWSRYILSDITYMCLNFSIFYVIANIFLKENGADMKKYWVLAFALLLINISYRPVGLVMIPVVFGAFLFGRLKQSDESFKMIHSRYVLFPLLAILVMSALIFHTMVMKNSEIWPFSFADEYIKNFVVPRYYQGVIIDDRPHTYHLPPASFADYAAITLSKLIHYFYFTDVHFSLSHRVINWLVFMPSYLLCIIGLSSLLSRKIYLDSKHSLISICVLIISFFALYHAMTVIDFDWRYRLPVIPYLLVIASIGTMFLKQIFFHTKSVGDHTGY
jgi:hypothetical protein